VLWLPLYLALGRRLGGHRPAARFGRALAIVGLGVLAAGAVPHAATARLSDLYHAPPATEQARTALVMVWQGVQGIFDALLVTGLLIVAAGVVLLGLAMPADGGFGRWRGGLSVGLGLAALGAGIAVLVEPTSPVAALGFFALIGFHFVLGARAARLDRSTVDGPQ
jgi:hypothetical protein